MNGLTPEMAQNVLLALGFFVSMILFLFTVAWLAKNYTRVMEVVGTVLLGAMALTILSFIVFLFLRAFAIV
jgi:hypothetical protein